MEIAEQIERQERANAAADCLTLDEYRAVNAARVAWYLANKREIDARIAADDAECGE